MTYRDKETTLLAEIERLNLKNQELEKSLVSATKQKERKLEDDYSPFYCVAYLLLTFFCFLAATYCLISTITADTVGIRFSLISAFMFLTLCGAFFCRKAYILSVDDI